VINRGSKLEIFWEEISGTWEEQLVCLSNGYFCCAGNFTNFFCRALVFGRLRCHVNGGSSNGNRTSTCDQVQIHSSFGNSCCRCLNGNRKAEVTAKSRHEVRAGNLVQICFQRFNYEAKTSAYLFFSKLEKLHRSL